MSHPVLDSLSKIATPEKMVIYREAVLILLQKDPSLFSLIFDNFHNSMFESDSISNLMDFDELMIGNLRVSAEEFGVYINEDFMNAEALQPLLYLTKMLYGFDGYDDVNELLTMLEAEVTKKELMAEYVTTITGYNNVEGIMSIIDEVSPSLIKQLDRVLKERVKDLEENPIPVDDKWIHLLQEASQRFDTRIGYEILREGHGWGKPFEFYAERTVTSAESVPSEIVKGLMIAAILARVEDRFIKDTIGNYVNERWADNTRTAISIGREFGKLAGF